MRLVFRSIMEMKLFFIKIFFIAEIFNLTELFSVSTEPVIKLVFPVPAEYM